MTQHSFFVSVIIILIIILLIKFYLESEESIKKNISSNNRSNNFDYPNNYTKNDYKYDKMLEEVRKETMTQINNAVEEGYAEGFQAMNVEIKNNMLGNLLTNRLTENMDDSTNIGNFYKNEYNSDTFESVEPVNTVDTVDTFDTVDNIYNNDFKVKSNKNNRRQIKSMQKNKNKNDNIISYLNKGNSEKLMLFYKPSCPYCSDFMPVWYKIINNLSNNVLHEEINCETDHKKANEYNITSVPTLILLVKNEKKIYSGDRNYVDIMTFLRNNGVTLIQRTFEEFDTTGYVNDPLPTGRNTDICQDVTFNTQNDIAQDQYMFQIFNADGQYGYSVGGNKSGNLLSPFTAAYATVDSYLTSLPEGANLSSCASKYADQIRSFGLCDKAKLDNIAQYQKNISQGLAKPRVDGTDYSSNNKVLPAIKNACRL